MLEVRLIGKFDIKNDGKPVIISSRVAQSLFTYLILTAGTLHRREKLAGMFWPDATEEKARAYLRHELWHIRKALSSKSKADYLIADDISVSFNSSSEYWLDVTVLKKRSESASISDLRDALSVYNGQLLPDFYDEWVFQEREHLQAFYEQKIARLLELLESEKCWPDILEWSEQWISHGQGPEAAYRYLMIAYDALGDRAKVALTYERCVQALRQLDLEPSEQTRALAFKRISKLNIPVPLTSFIGRKDELKEVAHLLSKSRLVTLTGSGGVGKTRLAIQVVADVLERFPDGVWFLDLTPVSDPALVPDTLSEVLDLSLMGGSDLSYTDHIIRYLSSRRALIIFDNCEHLIESCAQLVHSMLTSCEHLSILATSREALRVSGEIPYRVPSLEIPKRDIEFIIEELANTESIKLFTERAAVVSPGFTIGAHNALVIAQICQRLGGIPLAIELAAALVNVLAVEQILKRLDDRFNLLTGGLRTALPRHKTLRATIEWSYELLSQIERILFQRLAVFVGGWTLEAAEAVCSGNGIETSEVLDLLSHLVDKSLALAEAMSDGTRYRRLETIRQFAAEKLLASGEGHQLRQQHCAYYLDLAERADRETYWPDKQKWKERLEIEDDNFRTALEWCVSEESTEAALRLLGFWAINGRLSFGEQQGWFTRILNLPNVRAYPTLYARLLNHIGGSNWLRGSELYAKSVLEESQAIWLELGEEGELGLAEAWTTLGEIAHASGKDSTTAQILFEKSIELYQKHGNDWGLGRVMFGLGHKAMYEGNYSEAEQLYMKGLAKWKKLGDKHAVAAGLNELGELARLQGDYDRAGKYYEQGLKTARELRGQNALPLFLFNYAWVSLHAGNYPNARSMFKECLELRTKDGNTNGIIDCLAGFAGILGITGRDEEAAQLFGAFEHLLQEGAVRSMDPSDQKEVDHYLGIVREQLDEATFAKAWAEGSEMTLEQAVAFAVEETSV
jgi:predicted ATPase/DNA-binding SARP family transcriptional activator